MYGPESLIKRFLVLNRTDGDAEPVFTLTAPAVEHLRLIVSCINAGLGTTDWKVGTVEGSENIVIDYEGKYCDEALKELAEKAGTEYWTEGTTVNLCRCETGEEITLGYGQGLTGLMRDTADNVKFYTRLFPIGSSRNIDRSKYGHARLMLPGGRKYADLPALVKEYGVIHHYEKDSFAGIYPRRIGTVSAARHKEVKGEDGKPFTIYYIQDAGLDFDPNDYQLPGEVIRMSFQEGSELAGLGTGDDHYFEVNFDSKTKEFEIITIWPYSDGTQLPGGSLIPKRGDKYVLWNLRMPAAYITLAEEELRQAVDQFNARHGIDIARYKGQTDHVWIEDNNVELAIGQRVRLESKEFFPATGFRKSRITKIIRRVNLPSLMDVEISDALSRGQKEKINDSITAVRNYTRSIAGSLSLPDIIRQGDGTQATDNNLFSAARAMKEFLNKNIPDTARELITFLKGIAFQGGHGIDGEGKAKLLSLIVSVLQSADFDEYSQAGFGITRRKDGKYQLSITDLIVWGKAIFNELEIRKLSYVGGNMVFSSCGSKIMKVVAIDQNGDEIGGARKSLLTAGGKFIPANGKVLSYKREAATTGDVSAWRCYFYQDDGTTATTNLWAEGDLARCETFNIKAGKYQGVGNRRYWRKVTKVGDDYIDLSASDCEAGSGVPAAGDALVQMGNRTNTDRQSLIFVYVNGDEAPAIVWYDGISDYTLKNKMTAIVSPRKVIFNTQLFKILTPGGETKSIDDYVSEKAGSGAVMYRLQVDEPVVKITADGTMSVTEIRPKVARIEGGHVAETWNAETAYAKGVRVAYKTSKMDGFTYLYGFTSVQLTADMTMVTFRLVDAKDVTKFFDIVSVPIIKDGADAKGGYSVICSPSSVSFDTNENGSVEQASSKKIVVSVKNGEGDVGIKSIMVIPASCINITEGSIVVSGNTVTVNPAGIEHDGGVSRPSAGFQLMITTTDDTVLYYTVPVSVNINRYLSTIESNSKEYKRRLDEFTGGVESMIHFKSEVLQSAREISQEVSEKAIGGNNLLKDSEFKRLDSVSVRWPHLNVCVVKNRGYNGTNAVCVKLFGLTGSDTNYNGLFWSEEHVVKIDKGATYTFSFYAMSPDPAKVENVFNEVIYWDSPTGGRKSQLASMNLQGQLTTTYRLFTHTFTIPETSQYEYIEITLFSLRNGEVYFSRPCLTKTSTHVGWSKSKGDKEYIGGNLINGSQKFDAAEFQAAGTLTPNGYENFTTLRLNSSCQYTFKAGEIKPDADYMLSMWVKSTGSISVRFKSAHEAVDTCRLVENSDGQFTTDPYAARDGYSELSAQAEFTRVWVHFRTRSTVPAQVRLYITGSGELCGMKLEQGVDMTAWTDSRETLTFSLKDLSSYIKQSSDKIELNVTDGVNKAGLTLGAGGGFTARGNNFKFQDSNGNTHLALTEDGKLKGELIEAQKVTAWNIAQPFQEYASKDAFIRGNSLSWVITEDLHLENSQFLTNEGMNGAVINIYNGTGGTVDMGMFPLFLGSAGYGTISIRKLSTPAYTLFRALCVGIRANGPNAPVQVGLYPLVRCTVNSTYVYVRGMYD